MQKTCKNRVSEYNELPFNRLILIWEQGVAGSNPVSPTIDNQPLAATQVVFLLGPAAHNLHAKSEIFRLRQGRHPRKSRIFRLRQDRPPAKAGFSGCIKAGSPQKSISAPLRIARLRGFNHIKEPPPHASGKQTLRSTIDPGAPTAAEPSRPEPPPIRVTTNPGDPPRALRSPEPRRRRSLSRPEARQTRRAPSTAPEAHADPEAPPTRRAPSATPEASRSHLPCPPGGQSRRVRMRHRTPCGVCTVSKSSAR